MKSKIILAVVGAGLLTCALAGDTPQPAVVHFDYEKVAAAFTKGKPLLITDTFKVLAGRRDAPGPVEIHERDTDVFYVLDGSATFVTGGKGVDMKTVSPGEIRGKEIVGGEPHHLVKGDVIVIPNGVPHWFKEVNGPFTYFVVKVTK